MRHEWVGDVYADLLLEGDKINLEQLEPRERKVLGPLVRKFQNFKYGESMSRQIFLTIFKDFYNV